MHEEPIVDAPKCASGQLLLGRYRLVDRAGGTEDAPLWRADDSRLRRPVLVLLLRDDDPRSTGVRSGASEAAKFIDRRAVPVLDVGTDDSGSLVVVSEWMSGIGFGDHLASQGPSGLPSDRAGALAGDLASVLVAAHEHGVVHGHLRPNSIAIGEAGEIRLRGLGVSGPLAAPGISFEAGQALDVAGIGAVLYAGLTGRWPGTPTPVLPAPPRLASGAVPWPSRVVADVPAGFDAVAARSTSGCALPKGQSRFVTAAAVSDALSQLAQVPDTAPPPRARNRVGRAVGALAAAVLVVGLVAAGVGMAQGPVTKPGAIARNTGSIGLGLDSQSPAVVQRPIGGDIPVVAVYPLDPFRLASVRPESGPEAALDDDPSTVWLTRRFKDPGFTRDRGTGIVLDLGAPRPVSALDLRLLGNGTDVTLLAGDDSPAFADLRAVTKRAGAPGNLTIRLGAPLTARYIAIWLTKLPPAGTRYQGGISAVTVRS